MSEGVQPVIQNRLVENWWLLLLWGAAAIVMGLLLLSRQVVAGPVALQIMATFWLVGGLFDIFESSSMRGEGSRVWLLVGGVIRALAGIIVIADPIAHLGMATATLFSILAFSAAFNGVFNILAGLRARSQAGLDWSWGNLLLGVFQLLIGLFLLERPLLGTLTAIAALGLIALVGGITAIVLAFRVRGMTA